MLRGTIRLGAKGGGGVTPWDWLAITRCAIIPQTYWHRPPCAPTKINTYSGASREAHSTARASFSLSANGLRGCFRGRCLTDLAATGFC